MSNMMNYACKALLENRRLDNMWFRLHTQYSCCVLVQETSYTKIDERSGCGKQAKGLYEQINHFNFFFGLRSSYVILISTDKLSCVIQRSSCCLKDVFYATEIFINDFTDIQGKKDLRSVCNSLGFSFQTIIILSYFFLFILE